MNEQECKNECKTNGRCVVCDNPPHPDTAALEKLRQWYAALHPTFCEALRVSGFPAETMENKKNE